MKLLSRDKVVLLNEKASQFAVKPIPFPIAINEKAVDWEHSLIGRSSKGIGGLFSMLSGKIKAGFDKAKIHSLVIAWGTEYVIALEAAKKGIKVDTSGDGLEGASEDGEDNKDATAADTGVEHENPEEQSAFTKTAKEFGPKISNGLAAATNVSKGLDSIQSWIMLNNPKGLENLRNTISKDINFLIDPNNTQALEDFLFDNGKRNQYNEILKEISLLLKVISDPNSTITELDKTLGTKGNTKLFKDKIKAESQKIGTIKQLATEADSNYKLWNSIIGELENLLKLKSNSTKDEASKELYTKELTDAKTKFAKQLEDSKKVIENNKDSKSPAIIDIQKFINLLSSYTNESYNSSINEADTQSLTNIPKYITDVFPVENLDEFKAIKDIKVKSLKNVNINKLDIINYQAEDIISKSKQKTKDGVTSDVEKEWTLGLKYLNTLFDSVINTNSIMKSLGKTTIGEDIKKQVTEQDAKFKELENMGFDEKLPAKGGKFINSGLYAFQCSIKYMQEGGRTALEDIYLLVSPTAQFIEDLDGKQYYWHKCFGQYKYNDETKQIEKVNFLSQLTKRQKPISKNEGEDDYIYIAFTNQSVTAKFNPAYFYTKVGFFPLGKEIIKNVSSVADALAKYDHKKWRAEGNELDIAVRGRYSVLKENISKYPSIDQKALKNDKGFDIAKANHDLLMPIITKIEAKKK